MFKVLQYPFGIVTTVSFLTSSLTQATEVPSPGDPLPLLMLNAPDWEDHQCPSLETVLEKAAPEETNSACLMIPAPPEKTPSWYLSYKVIVPPFFLMATGVGATLLYWYGYFNKNKPTSHAPTPASPASPSLAPRPCAGANPPSLPAFHDKTPLSSPHMSSRTDTTAPGVDTPSLGEGQRATLSPHAPDPVRQEERPSLSEVTSSSHPLLDSTFSLAATSLITELPSSAPPSSHAHAEPVSPSGPPFTEDSPSDPTTCPSFEGEDSPSDRALANEKDVTVFSEALGENEPQEEEVLPLSLDTLPDELKLHLLSFLSLKNDRDSLALVCQNWQRVVQEAHENDLLRQYLDDEARSHLKKRYPHVALRYAFRGFLWTYLEFPAPSYAQVPLREGLVFFKQFLKDQDALVEQRILPQINLLEFHHKDHFKSNLRWLSSKNALRIYEVYAQKVSLVSLCLCGQKTRINFKKPLREFYNEPEITTMLTPYKRRSLTKGLLYISPIMNPVHKNIFTILDVSCNELLEIPEGVYTFSRLVHLSLSYNYFRTLPPAIGQLQKLSLLSLGHNLLTSVPQELYQLKTLKVLDLSFNRLTGLSQELGQLTSLKRLNLEGNLLPEIPEEIGHLGALTELDLSYNHLTHLPETLRHLKHLQKFSFHHNPLSTWPACIEALFPSQGGGLNDLDMIDERFETPQRKEQLQEENIQY